MKFFDVFQILCQKFHTKITKNTEKSQNQQSLACVPTFSVSEGADQIMGQLKHLAAHIFEKVLKFVSKF